MEKIALKLRHHEMRLDEIGDSDLRDGFEVGNADKIFESTYTRAADLSSEDNDEVFLESRGRILSYLGGV